MFLASGSSRERFADGVMGDHSYRSSIAYRPPALTGRGAALVPSRQFGYPLSFRVQVYRVHAPSRVSRQWFSPRDASLSSFGSRRARFPALSGTMKALRLPTCVSMVAYWFASTAHAILLFSCSAVALPEGRRALPGQGLGFAGRPLSGLLARGRKWDLSGLQAIHPVPLLRSRTPVEPTCPRHSGHVDAAPAIRTAKASAMADFGANPQLRHLLPYASRVTLPHTCKACFRLAGSAFTGRESNPLDRYERFQFI
jgi:hypothetical protein